MQNLVECAVVLTRKVSNPIPFEDVSRLIHDITSFNGWNILHYNEKTILNALEIQKATEYTSGMPYWLQRCKISISPPYILKMLILPEFLALLR